MKKTSTLRQRILRIILRIALVLLSSGRQPAAGQTQTAASGALLADAAASAFAALVHHEVDVRYDLVDPNYRPTAYGPDVLLRSVRALADGRFAVRVIAADGTVRMTGCYADAGLSVGEGAFEYFHADGSLESRGSMLSGLKTGAWERYALDGHRLPDRLYALVDNETLQLRIGEASKARDLSSSTH